MLGGGADLGAHALPPLTLGCARRHRRSETSCTLKDDGECSACGGRGHSRQRKPPCAEVRRPEIPRPDMAMVGPGREDL